MGSLAPLVAPEIITSKIKFLLLIIIFPSQSVTFQALKLSNFAEPFVE